MTNRSFIALIAFMMAAISSIAQSGQGNYFEIGIGGGEVDEDVPKFYCTVQLDDIPNGAEILKLYNDLVMDIPASNSEELYHIELYNKDGELIQSLELDTNFGNADPGETPKSAAEKAHRLMFLAKDQCN